ncbi:MAG: DegV family protein [Anaerotardibacter sp.]
MSLLLVCDSSSDLYDAELVQGEVFLKTVPFSMLIGGKNYIDDESLDIEEFVSDMESCKELGSSACPSPQSWASIFEEADEVIAFTISSNLSGSHNSAESAKKMVHETYPDKKIEVIDSFSTGPGIIILIDRLLEWRAQGETFEGIVAHLRKYVDACNTVFALSSFGNLAKNGRVSKTVGIIATHLPIWGVGRASTEGTIEMVGKAKGKKGVLKMIIGEMEDQGFAGGDVVISHCFNLELAQKLADLIVETWPTAQITIHKTRGLDSFYAERSGLIIGYC